MKAETAAATVPERTEAQQFFLFPQSRGRKNTIRKEGENKNGA